jgi:transcriptional regulator with XRE-family HTH domain
LNTMTTIQTIQALSSQRKAAGISGAVLAAKANIGRSKLSEIERGHCRVTADELERLATALEELIQARKTIREAAIAAGWPELVA